MFWDNSGTQQKPFSHYLPTTHRRTEFIATGGGQTYQQGLPKCPMLCETSVAANPFAVSASIRLSCFLEHDNTFPGCYPTVLSHLLRAISTPPYCTYFLAGQTRLFSNLSYEFINMDGRAIVSRIPHNERYLRTSTTNTGHFAQA